MPSDSTFGRQELRPLVTSQEAELRALFRRSPHRAELEAAYEQLRLAQEKLGQQERLQALAELSSGIAHDLNNSLTPIVGFSDFLLDTPSRLSVQAKRCLEGIRSAAGDIVRTVENLRQFYRIRDAFEPLEALDLNCLIRQVLEQLQPRLRPVSGNPPIQVKVELDPHLPTIRDRESEFHLAISHLVLNAIEAMPAGGALTITTQAPAASEPPNVLLQVQDTGIGMDGATRRRCLEPFFTTKAPRGRGLGLAVVYGVVHRHGGSIEIESEPGRGATVRLILQPGVPSNQDSTSDGVVDHPHAVSPDAQEAIA